MARIFVTGSTTGLGLSAGRALLAEGHEVIFHARNAQRGKDLAQIIGDAPRIAIGDLGTVAGTLEIADQINGIGAPDAVIHNAGLGADTDFTLTADGIPDLFGVNVLAPYILTARIRGPKRLVYLSSDMHFVTPDLEDMLWRRRTWSGYTAYSESKFLVTALAFAVARLRPDLRSNAVDPGWVPTRMGGSSASDDLAQGGTTQAALASGAQAGLGNLTGEFRYHLKVRPPQSGTRDPEVQTRLLAQCQALSGIAF